MLDVGSGIGGKSMMGILPTFPHFPRNVRYPAGMSSKNGYPTIPEIGVFDHSIGDVENGGEDVEKVGRFVDNCEKG